jgi:serine/threonine protein kinase
MKLSQENPSLNVVKIFGIQVKKLDKFNLVMYVLMEAAQCDWENEIRNRSQYQAYYTEEELMKILLNLSTTLASLQKMGICHRDVKPQNILCFGKDNYKLSDFGEAKKKKKRKINGNFIYDFEGDTSKQTVRGTELYMSPILFKALHDCPEIDLEYNAYKSDVFSLGLCMLLSSTLGFQALYDIRELYDNNKIKKIVEKYLSPRYSKDYVKLIISMLQIKEKNRPDFIELQNNIQQIYYHKNSKDNKDK